jgi:hypothetical protein
LAPGGADLSGLEHSELSPGQALALQRTAGNRAVARLISGSSARRLARQPTPPEVTFDDLGVEEEYRLTVGGHVIAEFIPANQDRFVSKPNVSIDGRRITITVHHMGGELVPIDGALAPTGWRIDLQEVDDRLGEFTVNPPTPVATFDDALTVRMREARRKAREREERERKRREAIRKAIEQDKWDVVASLMIGATGVDKAAIIASLDNSQLDKLDQAAAALKDRKAAQSLSNAIAAIRKVRRDQSIAMKVAQVQDAAARHLWDDAALAMNALDRDDEDALLDQFSEAQLRQLRAAAGRMPDTPAGMREAIDKAIAGRKSATQTWENQRLAFWSSTGQEILAGTRSDLTFDSYEGAIAYAQSLGRAAAVMEEGLQFAVYDLKGNLGSWRKEDVILGGGRTRIVPEMVPVRAFITTDGWVVEARFSHGGYAPAEATQRYSTGAAVDPFAGELEAFGAGLAGIQDHDGFMRQFERAMRELVLSSLDRSKQAAAAKRDALRDQSASELAQAKRTASAMVVKDQELAAANERLRKALDALHGNDEYDSALRWVQAGQGAESDPGGKVAEARAKANAIEASNGIPPMREEVAKLEQQRAALVGDYSMLSWVSDIHEFDALSDEGKLAYLRDVAERRVPDATEDIRQRVMADILDLWALGNVVSATLVGLGVTDPTRRKWVKERVEHARWVKNVTEVAIAVVGIGLAVAGIFVPPLLLVSFAVNAGLAVKTAADYYEQQALSSTDIDRSQALLSPDSAMGWGWVAVAFIGLGLEGAGVLKALRAVAPAVKALEAGGTLTEFETAIGRVSQLSAEEQAAAIQAGRGRQQLAEALRGFGPAAGKVMGSPGFLGGNAGPLLRQLTQIAYLGARQGVREFSAFTAWLQRQFFRVSIDFSKLSAEERALVEQAFERGRAEADAARRLGVDVLYSSEMGGQVAGLRLGRTAGTGGITRVESRNLAGNARSYRIDGEIRDSLVREGPAPPGRTGAPGFEAELPSVGEIGRPNYRRAHQWGPGWGDEARAGIMYAPESVNNRLQSLGQGRGIEGWIAGFHKKVKPLGGRVRVSTVTESYPRANANDPLFLKSAQYEVVVEVPGQPPRSYRAHIEVDPPPTNTQLQPKATVEITELTDPAGHQRPPRLVSPSP